MSELGTACAKSVDKDTEIIMQQQQMLQLMQQQQIQQQQMQQQQMQQQQMQQQQMFELSAVIAKLVDGNDIVSKQANVIAQLTQQQQNHQQRMLQQVSHQNAHQPQQSSHTQLIQQQQGPQQKMQPQQHQSLQQQESNNLTTTNSAMNMNSNAGSDGDSGPSWSVVAARHRPTQVVRKIVGSKGASGSPSKLVAAPSPGPKTWHLFVGQLGKDVESSDLEELLADVGIKCVEVRKLSATQPWMERTSAFRVSVDIAAKDDVMNPAIWPDNVAVRDWFFKPK
jgi:hypothetical protein